MSSEPGDFGSRLRRARESRGLSLRDIAEATKISTLVLEALERGDAARLPGGLFSRAFVREYAKQVGLDPEKAVREFLEAFPDTVAPIPSREHRAERARSAPPSRAGLGWLGLAITVLLIAVFVVVNRYVNPPDSATNARPTPAAASQPRQSAQPIRAAETPSATAQVPIAGAAETPATRPPAGAPNAAATGGATADARPGEQKPGEGQPGPLREAPVVRPPQPAPPPTAPEATGSTGASAAATALHIELTATSPCWVSVSVDGNRVPGRMLQPGDRLQLDAASRIVLTAGDAGALVYTVNGAPGRSLGAPGEVAKNIVISVQNYQTYVAGR